MAALRAANWVVELVDLWAVLKAVCWVVHLVDLKAASKAVYWVVCWAYSWVSIRIAL
jgi:hypothetical protein